MTIDRLRSHCLAKEGSEECFPFDDVTLVFKVYGRIFALVSLDEHPMRVNLKCDPERARELRDQYDAVIPGYHMNKRLWNTIVLDGSIPDREVISWIDDSYELNLAAVPKSKRISGK